MKRLMKDESGVALVFTLMVLVVLSVLGATMGTVAMANVNLTENERDYQAAYYIAEAGVNEAYLKIEEKILEIYGSENIQSEAAFFDELSRFLADFDDDDVVYDYSGTGDKKTASVEIINNRDNVTINSVGNVNEKIRNVSKNIKVKWVSKGSSSTPSIPANARIYIENNVEIKGNPSIDGDIYAGGNLVVRGNPSIDGDIYAGGKLDVSDNLSIGGNSYEGSSYVDFETIRSYVNSIEAPKTGKDMIEISNSDLNGTYIAGTSPYIFNKTLLKIDSGTVNLVFDDLRFNHDLEIEGDGVLNIFVKGTITNITKLNIGGDPKQLNIFYMGNDKVKFTNHKEVLNGSLYIKNADFEMTGGVIKGTIVANEFKATGGVIKGTIVANEFKATGGEMLGGSNSNQIPLPDSGDSVDLSDLINDQPIKER